MSKIKTINPVQSDKSANQEPRAPQFISLFAGCGGSSYGYQQAGFHEKLAIEWDKHARLVFKLNFPNTDVQGLDISKLTGKSLLELIGMKKGELDLFDASPPCQAFSASNTKRNAYDERNDLYLKTIKLIGEVQPKVFVVENVEGMRRGKMIQVWNQLVKEFNSLNYRIEFKIVKAEQFGVPQERRRVIVIGVRNDIAKGLTIKSLFPQPTTTAEQMAVNKHLPYLIGFSPGQFQDNFMFASRPMCTITKTSSAWVYEKDGLRRKPTIDELKILSSFPESFQFTGSYIQQFARIGNAVPPAITKAIGEHILINIFSTKDVNQSNQNVENEYTNMAA